MKGRETIALVFAQPQLFTFFFQYCQLGDKINVLSKMTHFWADFARFRGAFFSITHYLLEFSGKNKIKNEVCDSLGPGDHGCRRFFFQFAVFQMLLTENKMDILFCTD